MPSKKEDDKRFKIFVCMEVSVDKAEWMEKYGEGIKARGIVPVVSLEKAFKKQARQAMENLGLQTLEIK